MSFTMAWLILFLLIFYGSFAQNVTVNDTEISEIFNLNTTEAFDLNLANTTDIGNDTSTSNSNDTNVQVSFLSNDPPNSSNLLGASAAIFATIFIGATIVAYGGLIIWRRLLHVRYGPSDQLITEEVYDISDLRKFEI